MSANTNERFREVEPLSFCELIYTAYIDWKNLVVIDATYFSVSEARALRDWLNKALPEEKP